MGAILILLGLVGLVAAANSGDDGLALSDDCKTNRLAGMSAAKIRDWYKAQFEPAYRIARDNVMVRVAFKVQGADDVLWVSVQPDDPEDVAAFVYSWAVSGGVDKPMRCALTYATAAGGLVFPSKAAECLYLGIELAVRAQLATDTGDASHALSPGLVASIHSACWPPGQAPSIVTGGTAESALVAVFSTASPP